MVYRFARTSKLVIRKMQTGASPCVNHRAEGWFAGPVDRWFVPQHTRFTTALRPFCDHFATTLRWYEISRRTRFAGSLQVVCHRKPPANYPRKPNWSALLRRSADADPPFACSLRIVCGLAKYQISPVSQLHFCFPIFLW
jgi:hypothetical protein